MNATHPATVTLTIDGRAATVPFGATILDAAKAAGVKIPHLCKHEWIHRLASCRLCVVKIAGVEGVVAACATPAAEGMSVTTNDDELLRLRRQQMQFILLNHPLDCPVCDKGGECKLQDLTYALGVTDVPFRARLEGNRLDKLSPLIERNDERCVRCGRCVAVCEEVQAVGAYKFAGRGYHVRIDTKDGGPLNCEFCGQCVAICPVGALLSKQFLHKARVWELQRTTTVCGYCGAGCQLELATRRGKIYRTESDRRTSLNNGKLCIRGRFGWDFAQDERRAATPLIRRDGRLVPATWDEALDLVAENLRTAWAGGGPNAVAAAAGARLPLEDLYALGQLFGAANTAIVGQDGCAEAFKVVRERLGRFGSTATFADLRSADALLLLGSDLAAEMPVPHLAALAAAREGDARLVVAHPTPTKLEDFATARLRFRPGAAGATAVLLLHELLAQQGQRSDFIMQRTDGFAAFRAALDRLNLDELREESGLTAAAVHAAAAALAHAQRPVIVLGPQAVGGSDARAVTETAVALLLALGGAENGLLFSADRCNLAGALLVGAGAAYAEVIDAGRSGRLGALLLVGGDPLVCAPQADGLRKAMEVTRFVVACDAFVGETAKKAHVFLPTTTFVERGGTYLSAENRLLSLNAAVKPHGDAWPEWQIFAELAKRLGKSLPGDTLADLRTAALAAKWDDARVAPAGAKYHFGELPAAGTAPRGEMTLVVGPMFQHNGALSSWSKAIAEAAPAPFVELHPADAARCGLRAGDRARVAANGVELTAPVRLNERLTPGVAFAPPHFAAFPAGRLLDGAPAVAVHIEKEIL
jgi:predicted molibdopterin-dependent oxidoreductase YjgC